MTRIIVKLTLTLSFTFLLAIALLHVRAYDDSEWRTLIGCDAPCWQGIRPGVTSRDEAIALLQNHPWVTDLLVYGRRISWSWSGQQPTLIDSSYPGMIWAQDERVQQVKLSLNVPFGDVWLLFDQPQSGGMELGGVTIAQPRVYRASHLAVYAYPDGVMQAQSILTCPLRPGAFWNANVELRLESSTFARAREYNLAGWFQNQGFCSERS